MTTVTISAGEPLHAGAIGRILDATNDQMSWLPRVHSSAEEIGYAGDMIEAGWVTVAKLDRHVVGFMAVYEQSIYALYVLPEVQNQGIGTRLLETAKAENERLTLWSYAENAQATRFYRLRGFVDVDRTDGSDNEAGLPDICFEWVKEQD
ncbi:MAG: GNAT family N-acetyltransferase [Pseudomonadota bacterium]